MKLRKVSRMMIAASFCAGMAGCVSRPSSFVVSSKPLEQGKYDYVLGQGDTVTGTCLQMSILCFSIGESGSSQSLALRDALSKVNKLPDSDNQQNSDNLLADALVSMAVDTEVFEIMPFLCPVIGFYKTRVTGIPVKTKEEKGETLKQQRSMK